MELEGQRYPAFVGDGTWNREAQRVTMLAVELGVPLDVDALVMQDIRELYALRQWLQTRPRRPQTHRLGLRWLRTRMRRAA
jgi:hypothetical protein